MDVRKRSLKKNNFSIDREHVQPFNKIFFNRF